MGVLHNKKNVILKPVRGSGLKDWAFPKLLPQILRRPAEVIFIDPCQRTGLLRMTRFGNIFIKLTPICESGPDGPSSCDGLTSKHYANDRV
jgi:hypothetical protein